MSRIVTFYSYKGGVGRTFALANIGVLLAKRKRRLLLMDWDLEAPGLHRYFERFLPKEGLQREGIIHLLTKASEEGGANWQSFVTEIEIPDCAPLHLITSGGRSPDYVDRVRQFSWTDFFEKHRGGEILDTWRTEWKKNYDLVFVDSRTGITDTGGVCTVFLPDILVLVFSANEQSLEQGIQVANGIQIARQGLAVRRAPVAILPLPGRFDGRDELDEADKWLSRFARDLKPFYDDWLPKQVQPRQVLEVTKIPYVTKFSFGEPLVVISHSITDPELPGHYLDNVARLLSSDFADAQQLIPHGGVEDHIAEFRAALARVPIDELSMADELKTIKSGSVSSEQLLELLSEAGVALLRQNNFVSAEDYLRQAVALAEEGVGVDHPDTGSSLFYLGEVLRASRRFSEAESAYRRALEITERNFGPNDASLASTYTSLAALYHVNRRASEAEDMYRRALEIFNTCDQVTDAANIHINLAGMYQETGRREEAEEAYKQAIDKFEKTGRKGDVVNTYANLSAMYQRGGRFDDAERVLLQSLEIDENQLHLRTELARVYQRQGKLDRTEAVLLGSLEIDPRQLHPRTELAMIYQRQNKLLEAEGILLGSLDIDARNLHVRTELASIYQRQGRLTEAEGILLQLLNIDAKNVQAHAELAKIYQRQGKLTEAEKVLLAVLDLDPRNLPAHTELARIYQRNGMLDRAEAILLESLRINDKQLQTRTELSRVYQRQARWREAEEVLLEALKIDPGRLDPRLQLGRIYYQQKRVKDAEDILLESLKIKPQTENARIQLSKIYQQEGRLQEAEDILLESLRIDPRAPQMLTQLARIYLSQEKLEQAEARAEEALRVDPINDNAMLELLIIWMRLGDKEKSLRRFQEFIAQPTYRFRKYSNLPILKFFESCKKFDMKNHAKPVFERFRSELNEQSTRYYKANFTELE